MKAPPYRRILSSAVVAAALATTAGAWAQDEAQREGTEPHIPAFP